MAIDFTTQRTFGSKNEEKEKAQYWLNIGYLVNVDEEERFISLPMGLALDTMTTLRTDQGDMFFRQFQNARNELLESMIEQARNLKPGESFYIACAGDTDLAIQIRRVQVKEQLQRQTGFKPTLFAIPKAVA